MYITSNRPVSPSHSHVLEPVKVEWSETTQTAGSECGSGGGGGCARGRGTGVGVAVGWGDLTKIRSVYLSSNYCFWTHSKTT